MRSRKKIAIGTRFGRLEVLGEGGTHKDGHGMTLCRCDCGTDKKEVKTSTLLHGQKSCGCLKNHSKHGKSKTHHLYTRWENMRSRCNNPNNPSYHNYGGRGIKVCRKWDNFQAFLDDMENKWQEGLLLDRIDVNKGYTPENCRWTTPSISARNTRPRGRVPFRGVTVVPGGRFRVYLQVGVYDTAQEACSAYEAAIEKLGLSPASF